MKNLPVLAVLALMLFNCSKDNLTSEQPTSEADAHTVDQSNTNIKLIYNNKEVEVLTDEAGNMDTSSLDENFSNAVNSAHTLRLDDNKTIFLFDSEEELDAYLISNFSTNTERNNVVDSDFGVNASAACNFYEHAHFQGGHINGYNKFYKENLQHKRFNDRISSIRVNNKTKKNYVVKCYEHAYRKGRVHTLIARPKKKLAVRNLKNRGFNDIISSINGYFL